MNKYSYTVIRTPMNKTRQASEALNALGIQGWKVIYATASGAEIVYVLEKANEMTELESAIQNTKKKKEVKEPEPEEEIKVTGNPHIDALALEGKPSLKL
jgi:predicted RND superfamily exporter protein